MSITSQTARTGPYTMAAFPQTCPTVFPFQFSTDLLVINVGQTSAPHDPPITLTLGSDYTVTGGGYNVGNQMQTGNVVVATGGANNVIAGDVIWILRNVPVNQIASAISAPLSTILIEEAIDKNATIAQQLLEQANRSLRFEQGEVLDGTLSLSLRKNSVMSFDLNGAITFQPLTGYQQPTPITSVANMKAISTTALVANCMVTLLGYYTPGDGGGGLFYYSPTSTATDDGGLTIAPTSGVGRWLRYYQGSEVYLDWFGTKGDGVTNDQPAIQSCVNTCQNMTRTKIILSGKTYAVGSAISISANGARLTLQGQGIWATRIISTSSTAHVFDVVGSLGLSVNNVSITDMTITRSVDPAAGSVAINLQYTAVFQGTNLQLDQHATGVYLYQATNTLLKNIICDILTGSAAFIGFDLAGGNTQGSVSSVFDNCYAINTRSGRIGIASKAFYLHGSYIMDLKFINCESSQCDYGCFLDGTTLSGTFPVQDVNFVNPVFDQCIIAAFDIDTAQGYMSVTITDGWAEWYTTGTGNTGIILNNCYGVKVNGFAILGFLEGVTMNGCKNITMSQMMLRTQTNHNFRLNSGNDGIVITGCTMANPSGTVLLVNYQNFGTTNSVFSGNTITGYSALGIYLDPTSSGNAVFGNGINPTNVSTLVLDQGTTNMILQSGSLQISDTKLLSTVTAMTNGSGASTGTLTNAPSAGNPTKWISINDAGTTRKVPVW